MQIACWLCLKAKYTYLLQDISNTYKNKYHSLYNQNAIILYLTTDKNDTMNRNEKALISACTRIEIIPIYTIAPLNSP